MQAGFGAIASAAVPRFNQMPMPVARELAHTHGFSDAFVINGNMLPGFSDPPNDPEFLRQIQSSGLTAVKYSLGGGSGSYAEAKEHLDWIDVQIASHEEAYLPIRSVADIADAKSSGRIGIIYAFEAATMFEADLARIAEFHQMGVRSMQLSYNNSSPFGSGVMISDEEGGITELGREAVQVMNAVGVIVDASHSNDRTTVEIVQASERPIMISHAGCAGVFQHPRNRSDHAIRAIAESGGVTGLYELSYLTPDLEQQTLSDYMRHLNYALNLCGEDHVGIGSDAFMFEFDTGPENMATWDASIAARREAGINAPGEGPPPFVTGLNGVHRMSLIYDALGDAGYSPRVADKVIGGNFLRVFRETWG